VLFFRLKFGVGYRVLRFKGKQTDRVGFQGLYISLCTEMSLHQEIVSDHVIIYPQN